MKNSVHTCLKDFSNVRNKTGLLECFQYLGGGREILIKAFLRQDLQTYFCVFSIDKSSYSSIVLKTKGKSAPYFSKVRIKKIFYTYPLYDNVKQQILDVKSFFTENEQTVLLLNNIL